MQKPEIPFFTRFLESQETETKELEVRTDIKAGGRFPVVTMKYPSDNDDDPPSI